MFVRIECLALGLIVSLACRVPSPAPQDAIRSDESAVTAVEAATVETPTESPTTTPDEASVRPGINDKYFRDGALDRYTKIFEAESREVFERRDVIVETLALRPGMTVADIGAGTGLFTNLLAERVGAEGRVYAVDIVPEFLEKVAARAEAARLTQVTTVLGKERETALPPQSIDVVFMCNTYHHLEYPENYLRSVFDSLRPGGILWVIDFERIEGKSSQFTLDHVRAPKGTVIEEIQRNGFGLREEIGLLDENYVLRFSRP